MGKGPVRVTLLHAADGGWAAQEIIGPNAPGKGRRKPKRPKWARPAQRVARRRLVARIALLQELLERRDDANRERAWGSVLRSRRIRRAAVRKALRAFLR